MARINIEDGLYKKKGFQKLLIKLGDPGKAIGELVRAWIVAQKYWVPNFGLIPVQAWQAEELCDELLSCGMAEKRETGIYMKGSEEQFAWLIQKHKAARKGGLKSAEVRWGDTSNKDKRSLSPDKRSSSGDNPPTLSLSPTLKNNNTLSETSSDFAMSIDSVEEKAPKEKEHRLVKLWNELANPIFPRCKKVSTRRQKQIQARFKELPDIEDWRRVIEFLNRSDFYKGKNDRAWKASLDFILQPDRALKILEQTEDQQITKELRNPFEEQ